MQFIIKNINKSINDIMRTIGYKPAYHQKDEEFSIVRQIGRNDYPRFHLYIKPSFASSYAKATEDKKASEGQMQIKDYIFSLHLDQKRPSYKGSKAHSGEYKGKLIEQEEERIKRLLISNFET